MAITSMWPCEPHHWNIRAFKQADGVVMYTKANWLKRVWAAKKGNVKMPTKNAKHHYFVESVRNELRCNSIYRVCLRQIVWRQVEAANRLYRIYLVLVMKVIILDAFTLFQIFIWEQFVNIFFFYLDILHQCFSGKASSPTLSPSSSAPNTPMTETVSFPRCTFAQIWWMIFWTFLTIFAT